MERIIVLIFFCIAVEADIGKHIYIPKSLNWPDAQTYCRQYHTDLSYFNSQSDIDKLRKDAGGNIHLGWIGLHRDPNNNTAWMWSGGGHMTYQNWADGQPNNHKGKQNHVVITRDGTWNDLSGSSPYNFYCVNVTVVEEKMSWEDALSHCREKQTDLTSLISDTDLFLAHTKIKYITKRVWIGLRFLGDRWILILSYLRPDPACTYQQPGSSDALSHCREKQTDLPSLISDTDLLLVQTKIKNITERAWMGLRFLGDRWLWVNGDPLEYEFWSQEGGQDHQCPIRKRCGALIKEGLWENRDCQEKLYFICA
uniref:C-type lectin domain-containing protein n=1 Tax=Acanthochromis polyacanthus TaxID=80966 RepID=A0A3Q1GG89_9TELE